MSNNDSEVDTSALFQMIGQREYLILQLGYSLKQAQNEIIALKTQLAAIQLEKENGKLG